MSTLQYDNLTLEQLLSAVKQLSPIELHEFTRQFVEWQEQSGVSVKHRDILEDKSEAEEEAALLARISENSHLPQVLQQRFNCLRRKRQAETLTKSEESDLQALWQRVEQMNVVRLEALTKLAQRRSTDVITLMRELGLKENRDVF